mmetsp:Transcript_10515/g.23946  ORF Transcript_10515/g.23946 Transcript_10515/m.23946 type:complete len:228 (-) Transcript_10515:954-1637(-)
MILAPCFDGQLPRSGALMLRLHQSAGFSSRLFALIPQISTMQLAQLVSQLIQQEDQHARPSSQKDGIQDANHGWQSHAGTCKEDLQLPLAHAEYTPTHGHCTEGLQGIDHSAHHSRHASHVIVAVLTKLLKVWACFLEVGKHSQSNQSCPYWDKHPLNIDLFGDLGKVRLHFRHLSCLPPYYELSCQEAEDQCRGIIFCFFHFLYPFLLFFLLLGTRVGRVSFEPLS